MALALAAILAASGCNGPETTESFVGVGDPGAGTTAEGQAADAEPDPRAMTIERLRTGTIAVPFGPAMDNQPSVLVGGKFSLDPAGGLFGTISIFPVNDERGRQRSPIITDITGDGIDDAVVLFFRSAVPSGRTVLGIISDDELVDFVYVDYTGPPVDAVIRPGTERLEVIGDTIEVEVLPSLGFDDLPTETQQWVVDEGRRLVRVG